MFTSRAEYRLLLREDNADERLTPKARELGLVDAARWALFNRKYELANREVERLGALIVRPGSAAARALDARLPAPLGREARAFELLRRPEVAYDALTALEGIGPGELGGAEDDRLPDGVRLQVEVRARYSGYIDRQAEEIERHRRHEELALPEDLDYGAVTGLSTEIRQRLCEHRPATLGIAARIPGVTPAAISLLLVHLRKRGRAA
jgi:tRNA uridine 5-carboxymethylaminomethyl modification enzyme